MFKLWGEQYKDGTSFFVLPEAVSSEGSSYALCNYSFDRVEGRRYHNPDGHLVQNYDIDFKENINLDVDALNL